MATRRGSSPSTGGRWRLPASTTHTAPAARRFRWTPGSRIGARTRPTSSASSWGRRGRRRRLSAYAVAGCFREGGNSLEEWLWNAFWPSRSDMSDDYNFPQNFLWGAATAAYQVEGSPLSDGAAPSIWHRFAHTPGRMRNGDTGDVACDHYRRFREDIALMRELGLKAYRFSISWSRVLPDGAGAVNPKGLDFYDRLVDELLAQGIEPMATLYHWDLPAALDDRGGWLNPDVAGWFADYSRAVFRRLDGRVKLWVTLNEPWVVSDGGYLHGALAPGHRSPFEAPRASHNLMRAHAASVAAYRAEGRHQIGLVVNLEPKYPATASAEDVAATLRAEAYMNRQYLDAALLGRYPEELAEIFGEAWPDWKPEEVAALRVPIDFLGVNYYTRTVTRADATSLPLL